MGDVFDSRQSQYTDFLLQHYGASLYICQKMLAYICISSPSTAILCRLPLNVMKSLIHIGVALLLLAQLLGDETGSARHGAFWVAIMEAWKYRTQHSGDTQRSGNERASPSGYFVISPHLPQTVNTVIKQQLQSCTDPFIWTTSDGNRFEWRIDQEGFVRRDWWDVSKWKSEAAIENVNADPGESTYSAQNQEGKSETELTTESEPAQAIPDSLWDEAISWEEVQASDISVLELSRD
ncbi:uncharacterized protein AB675_7767 [Cyphellophora attinorum]|uniref:Uncharacterized protein n=1 Tax=Cyphellophora attinorum TaxID=1664694 RepID=A0A0N1H4V9_9EURO|nr:uncharacterized protein AB675_7767 [Phialophora attinorum]KPI40506.1 hypothetical protein AB675_7767 [Phialophora attinorum]